VPVRVDLQPGPVNAPTLGAPAWSGPEPGHPPPARPAADGPSGAARAFEAKPHTPCRSPSCTVAPPAREIGRPAGARGHAHAQPTPMSNFLVARTNGELLDPVPVRRSVTPVQVRPARVRATLEVQFSAAMHDGVRGQLRGELAALVEQGVPSRPPLSTERTWAVPAGWGTPVVGLAGTRAQARPSPLPASTDTHASSLVAWVCTKPSLAMFPPAREDR
jgi:hypothetical protein